MQDDFIHLARWVALGTMLLTIICTAAVLGVQVAWAIAGKSWSFLSVREVLELAARTEHQDVTSGIGLPVSPSIFERVLDLPAMFLLGSALGLLVVYYHYLKSL
jgi:hypothetical protein